MPESKPFAPEELLAHVEWVRRLAATLVAKGAGAEADDVAQETWRVALERPPRHAGHLRHWLAVAARNVARRLGASARTRTEHEGRVVPPGLAPSAAELVVRAQLQRRVVDAVLALDEPYRAALLYRFFEDLSTGTIAARVGVPVETVRTWLKRGLAKLRERLGEEFAEEGGGGGDWTHALAPLLAIRRIGAGTVTGSAVATGALLMVKSKAVAAALVVVVAGLAAWQLGAWRGRDRAAPLAGAAPTLAPAVAADGERAPAPLATRVEAAAAADREKTGSQVESPATANPALPALSGFVHTADGAPVAAATILLGRTDEWNFRRREALLFDYSSLVETAGEKETDHHATRSDEQGRFAFTRVAPGPWSIAAVRDDLGVAFRSDLVVDGRHATVDLLLEVGTVVTGRVFMPDGTPCARAHLEVAVYDAGDPRERDWGHTLGGISANESGEYRTIALPYAAFAITAATPEPTRRRTATPATSPIVEVVAGERERRIDVTLTPIASVHGRLILKAASRVPLLEQLKATFTEEELANKIAGAFGVFGFTDDPRVAVTTLTIDDPRSALGHNWVNGGPRAHRVTWISGSCDLDAATYRVDLFEPGIEFLAVFARKRLLASAAIPPSREGPDLVVDLDGLPPPLSRGRILVHVVDDATGEPVGSGKVVADVAARDGDMTTERGETFDIHGDGTAAVEVRGGEITLSADLPGFISTTTMVLLRHEAHEERTLRVARAVRRITGRVALRDGGHVASPELRAYRQRDGEWLALPMRETKFDGGGRFALNGMPDGALLLVASGGNGAPAFTSCAAAGDAEVELLLDPGVVVTLRAVPRDERTVGMVRYRILDEQRIPLVDDLAGGGIHFQDADRCAVRLPSGLCQVEAYSVDYEPSVASLRVAGDATLELGMHPRAR
jgi:RNA polymerase sigma-70 factor (ECF subfamily)